MTIISKTLLDRTLGILQDLHSYLTQRPRFLNRLHILPILRDDSLSDHHVLFGQEQAILLQRLDDSLIVNGLALPFD